MTVEEAAKFAGVVLPDSAESLGAYELKGIDRFMAFAVRLPQRDVATVLAASGFVDTLQPGLVAQYETVKGVSLRQSSTRSAQDERQVDGTDVFREVAVLSEGDDAVLHVWAYTT